MLSESRSSTARNAVPAGRVGPGIPDADIELPAQSEVALNQKVKKLIQKLGEAIHESVSESENIAGVVKNIRDQGFDVMLMLEATIGLNQVDSEDASDSTPAETNATFTHNDLSFLKSLRITLPEEEPETLRLEPPSESPIGPSKDA
jgi:hypothetical protein